MRKWLYDNPWIWVALFLAFLVAGSMVTLVIAELHKPEIVKVKKVSLVDVPASRTDSIRPSRQPARS